MKNQTFMNGIALLFFITTLALAGEHKDYFINNADGTRLKYYWVNDYELTQKEEAIKVSGYAHCITNTSGQCSGAPNFGTGRTSGIKGFALYKPRSNYLPQNLDDIKSDLYYDYGRKYDHKEQVEKDAKIEADKLKSANNQSADAFGEMDDAIKGKPDQSIDTNISDKIKINQAIKEMKISEGIDSLATASAPSSSAAPQAPQKTREQFYTEIMNTKGMSVPVDSNKFKIKTAATEKSPKTKNSPSQTNAIFEPFTPAPPVLDSTTQDTIKKTVFPSQPALVATPTTPTKSAEVAPAPAPVAPPNPAPIAPVPAPLTIAKNDQSVIATQCANDPKTNTNCTEQRAKKGFRFFNPNPNNNPHIIRANNVYYLCDNVDAVIISSCKNARVIQTLGTNNKYSNLVRNKKSIPMVIKSLKKVPIPDAAAPAAEGTNQNEASKEPPKVAADNTTTTSQIAADIPVKQEDKRDDKNAVLSYNSSQYAGAAGNEFLRFDTQCGPIGSAKPCAGFLQKDPDTGKFTLVVCDEISTPNNKIEGPDLAKCNKTPNLDNAALLSKLTKEMPTLNNPTAAERYSKYIKTKEVGKVTIHTNQQVLPFNVFPCDITPNAPQDYCSCSDAAVNSDAYNAPKDSPYTCETAHLIQIWDGEFDENKKWKAGAKYRNIHFNEVAGFLTAGDPNNEERRKKLETLRTDAGINSAVAPYQIQKQFDEVITALHGKALPTTETEFNQAIAKTIIGSNVNPCGDAFEPNNNCIEPLAKATGKLLRDRVTAAPVAPTATRSSDYDTSGSANTAK